MPSSATKKSRIVPRTSYRGASKVPLPLGGEVHEARQRQARRRSRRAMRSSGIARRIEVERVGPIPAHIGRARAAAAVLEELDGVEAHAGALETQHRRRRLEGLAVGDAVRDRHLAEAERRQVAAVDVKLAGQPPVDVVVVELERMAQVGDGPPRDAHARVDLFAAVPPWIPERKASGHVDRRVTAPR